MCKLSPIVRVLTCVVDCAGHDSEMCGTLTSQFVGHEPAGRLVLLLEESAEKAGRSFRIPPRLDEDIQDLTILIYSSIQTAWRMMSPGNP